MMIKNILENLEKCHYEISTEHRLSRVGLKDKQEIAPILEKYKWLFDLAMVGFVRKQYEAESDPVKKEELRRLFFELAGSFLYEKVVGLQDEEATFLSKSEVAVGGERVSYYDIVPRITKEPDFGKRESLQDAMFGVVEKVNPMQVTMLEEEIKGMGELGFRDYLDFYGRFKGMDYENFNRLVAEINGKVQVLYRKKTNEWVEAVLKRPWENIRNCHALYLMALNKLDQYFPKDGLLISLEKTLAGMGFDSRNKNIHIDSEPRPKKNPRAFCTVPKVPQEVHLIIKPVGGYNDYAALFHESGHCQNYAHVNPNLSYAFRHLSTSNALTETFAFLFESLTKNPLWLEKFMGLPRDIARQISFQANLEDLLMLVRYLAKFSYEYQMFLGRDVACGPQLYFSILTERTGFVYNPVMYLSDMDGGFYSADYLRAWIGEAQLLNFMEKEFGEAWFENEKAGEFLREIFIGGFEFELEKQLVKHGIGKPFDIRSLVGQYERDLA